MQCLMFSKNSGMKSSYKRLGEYIEVVEERNRDLSVKLSQGICNMKYFQDPRQVADNSAADKIVRKGWFAYNRATTRNGDKISIAYRDGEDCTVSASYLTFKIKDEELLNPYYLMMWFKRPEFDRYARFKSHGSAHEYFEWEEMCEVMLPVPPIEEQRKIVAEYQAVERRIENNRRLIATLEATAQTIYRKMFVDDIDPNNLPEGWRMGTIEEISEFVCAGTIPNYTDNGNNWVLGQKCNYNHTFNLAKARKHNPKASVILCQKGDVIINSTGEGTLGRVGIMKFDPYNLTFDSNMTLVRPKSELWVEYTYHSLVRLEQHFINICQGSTNQTRLYCSMVRPTVCIVPPESYVSRFHCLSNPILKYEAELENEVTIFIELSELLLSKLSNL